MKKEVLSDPKIRKVFDLFDKAGVKVYLVGGTVRDILRDKEVDLKDVDFATPTRPDETSALLKGAGWPCYSLGWAFGTVATLINDTEVHITTFRRKEHYKPGSRHPEVEFGGIIEEDLQRRDFRMNAMAIDSEGNLYDPFGGLEDIKKSTISVPGDTEETLSEDPLRLLRAARFIAQLGFNPDKKLKKVATAKASLILTTSKERWKMEMDKLLVGPFVGKALDYLLETSLLNYMIPELTVLKGVVQDGPFHHKDVWEHTKLALSLSPPDADIRWALLLHDIGKPYTKGIEEGKVHFYRHEAVGEMLAKGIMVRMRFSKKQREKVQFLIFQHMRPNLYSEEWSDSAIRRLAREAGEHLPALLEVSRADITSKRKETRDKGYLRIQMLQERISSLKDKDKLDRLLPKGLGTLIIEELKVPQGPQVGAIMKSLEEAIMRKELEPQQPPSYYLEYLKSAQRMADKR